MTPATVNQDGQRDPQSGGGSECWCVDWKPQLTEVIYLNRSSRGVSLHKIGFEFSSSIASNDHQVRILVDGEDWLGASVLGIDPPEFFTQAALTGGGQLLVGRCDCGCVGCGDVTVQVVRCHEEVGWFNTQNPSLKFSATQYDATVDWAKNDTAWETPNRTAERLSARVLSGLVLSDGFAFQWASTRVRYGVLSLSFLRQGVQRIIDLPWDGRLPESACESAESFLIQQGERSQVRELTTEQNSNGELSPPAR